MRNSGKLGRQIGQVRTARSRHAQIEIIFHIAVLNITCLRHESFNDTVECDIVILPTACQFFHPGAVSGRDIVQQLHNHRTIFQRNYDGVFRVLNCKVKRFGFLGLGRLFAAQRFFYQRFDLPAAIFS